MKHLKAFIKCLLAIVFVAWFAFTLLATLFEGDGAGIIIMIVLVWLVSLPFWNYRTNA